MHTIEWFFAQPEKQKLTSADQLNTGNTRLLLRSLLAKTLGFRGVSREFP